MPSTLLMAFFSLSFFSYKKFSYLVEYHIQISKENALAAILKQEITIECY